MTNCFFEFILDLLSVLGTHCTKVGYFVLCVWMTVLVSHHQRSFLTLEKPWTQSAFVAAISLLLFGVSWLLSKQKSPNNCCKKKRLAKWFLTSVAQSLYRQKKQTFFSPKYFLLCSSEEKRFPFKTIPVMLHSSKFNASGNIIINHLKRPLLLYRDMTLNFTRKNVLNTSVSFTLGNYTAARAWWKAAGQKYGRGLVISFAYSFARPNRISFSPALHSK